MYSFKNDYSEGAHPNIIDAMIKYNLEQEESYGLDSHTINAIETLKEHLNAPDADIHLLSGEPRQI